VKALFKTVSVLDPDADAASLVATALKPLSYEAPGAAEAEPDDWTTGIGNTFA
jgi:hypothetical protein